MGQKLSQRELARSLHIDECTVTNWERGRTQPTLQVLPRIIEFIGYRLELEVDGSLGGKIRQYRCLNGLSLNDLAKQLGVDIDTVRGWERVGHKPKRKLRNRLALFSDSIGHDQEIQ